MNAAEARAKQEPLFELVDFIPEEVSDVDRAANGRKYLVIKRGEDMKLDDDTLGPEVVASEDGTLTAATESDAANASAAESTQSKAALSIPVAVKGPLASALRQASEKLGALADEVGQATDTNANLETPTPPMVAKQMMACIAVLTQALEKWPAPGMKMPAPTDKQAPSEDVEKAGARMSRARRSQLENAIKILQKLLEDVIPTLKSAPRGAPTGERSSTDPNRANAGAGLQPDEDAAQSALETMAGVPGLADVLKRLTEVEGLKAKVQEQDKEIAQLLKSTGLPASRRVESPRPAASTEQPVSWPGDMNRPVSRESTPEEVSFFE